MKSNISRVLAMLTLGWGALPSAGWAWGPEGHEVVGEMAEHYLTPVAGEKVRAVLGGKRLGDFEISSWPDIIRGNKEYEVRFPGNSHWHYCDFDAAKHYEKGFKLTPPADGQDVVDQILRWQKELAAADTPPDRRLDALRFVDHFVGDVHQPLHCAYRYGDRGGNMIPVHSFSGKHYSFDADTPMDYPPNLHLMWDEYLVKELLSGTKPKAFAHLLVKEITPEQVEAWSNDDVLDWARESYWLARKKAYHWTNGKKLPFKWSRPGMDLTSRNYIDSHLPIVREQLKMAGVRLAHMVNLAFDPDYVDSQDTRKE